jgi:hypothetical protein
VNRTWFDAYSPIDPLAPDLNRFPLFVGVPILEVTLEREKSSTNLSARREVLRLKSALNKTQQELLSLSGAIEDKDRELLHSEHRARQLEIQVSGIARPRVVARGCSTRYSVGAAAITRSPSSTTASPTGTSSSSHCQS